MSTKKSKKPRCANCNKKLGLMPFKCKCGLDFCEKCICHTIHNCTFDYIEENKTIIQENLGGGEFKKFERIN